MKRLAAGCLIAMACTAPGQKMNPETFKSTYAVRDVALNTDPERTFWQGAQPVYAEVDSQGRPLPEYRTEVRSRWTSRNLYLLFICPTGNFI